MSKGISLPVVQSGLEASIQQGVKNVGKINIPATIDPSAFKNLAQPLGRVSGLATEFEKSIAASNARVLAFGASVGIINGVQNAFADLVRTGIEVQKTLADIAAISGQGGKQLSQFGDALFDIGKTTGQTFKTAAQAALEFSRQGLSVEETLKRTTDALTLTRFTTLNAAEAVDVLTAAANSFGETGITTAQIINKLVAVDTKFAVSAEDLANGLARAGSIAQEVGVNFDQLNAAITIAQERTARGGAVIGNALKTIFTRLRSDETVEALRSIGVESLNAQGQLKGAIPLLEEVAQKIQNLSGGERVQILEAIASKYNINILSALLNDLNGANSKFSQAVAVSAGASNQAYERQIELNKTLAAQINNATVSVTQLFNKLSEIGVTDSLATLLKFVSDLINGFNKIVDSEGLGGNIAKGLIKGISDVFFTIGLPIIGAIFIKLTRDIAQFGVESLKTILGINQQVRERQALEQAVVNTLIQDQQVMASILALSGNRAKQEEYLLGVYNRQLNALQQVKNIAASVTPALMAGGLTATTGRIERRGAGGYLPAQEAADVRRGVGGANPSSKVVSIPNFAFGGGKRGTMIANTSEYIVPNFANGGSAIFNKDMVRSYGLPAGAKKISAASGYVPNFVGGGGATWRTHYYVNAQGNKITQPKVWDSLSEAEKKQYSRRETYQDLTGKTLSALHPGGAVMLLPTQEMADEVNDKSMRQGVKPKEFKDIADFVKFRAYGFQGSRVKNQVKSEGENEGVAIASIAENIKKVITNEGARVVNLFKPLTKTPISGNEFEKLYDEKGGAAGAAAGVAGSIFEAAMDYSFNNKKSRAAQQAIAAAEANNITFDVLNFKQARVLKAAFGASGSTEAFADYKISPERARTFADQIIKNNVFAKASSGYVPNFAAGSPLGDAINREMAAGVSPSKIRITQDGRLRNAGNPSGLAVINTRDEPNGKIPNFASRGRPDSPADIKRAEKRAKERQAKQDAEDIALATMGAGGSTTVDVTPKKLAEPAEKLAESTEKAKIGLDKMFYAMSGLTVITSTLESSLGKLNSPIADAVVGLSKLAQGASQGALLGTTLKDVAGSKIGAGFGKALPIVGAVLGAAQTGLDMWVSSSLAKDENAPAKQAGIESVKDITKEADIKSKMGELGRKIIANPKDDKTNAAYDELKRKLAEINKSKVDAAKEEKKQSDELIKRIALTTKINSLNEAAAAGENAAQEKRAKRQSDFIRNSVFMTESQKLDADNNEKLLQIEEKRDDLKKSILLSTTKELAQGKLTTTEASAVENLRLRLEAGEDIKNVEQELLNLGIQGNSEAALKIKNALSELKIGDSRLVTESKITKERQEASKYADQEIKANKIRLSIIQDTVTAQRKLVDTRIQGARSIEDLKSQTAIIGIQNQISRQPFATRSQEASLARLNAELAKQNEIKSISRNFDDAIRSSERDKQDAYSKTASELYMLTDVQQEQLQQLIKTKNFSGATNFVKSLTLMDPGEGASWDRAMLAINNADKQHSEQLTTQNKLKEIALAQLKEQQTYELAIINLREKSPMQAGAVRAINEISKEAYNFQETFAYNTTNAFRDGLRDAMSAAISQTDDLGAALQNVAMNFLKTMQNAFLQNAANNAMLGLSSVFPSIFPKIQTKARGGLITGGSGYRDDVPAMLTGGEFVMRKSAVQKYGAANLAKMNSGGIFLPGVRGGGNITGYDQLRAFANQTTTSGATDILRGGGSSAFINLEDQSSRLSRFGLLNDDTINQEIRSAQEQGLNIIAQREAYRTQQRKAFQQQLVGTIASAALMGGINKLTSMASIKSQVIKGSGGIEPYNILGHSITPVNPTMTPYKVRGAYGGMIRRYASGGPVDDIPALLMSGEYVMNRGATSRYGRRFLDSMNQGRMSRFADGGEVGTSTTTTESNAKMMGDVSININVSGQGSQTETQGNTSQGGIDYKKMSERIKAVVLETINEEKRLGGALRTR
jgi:TP901 family phage tail tape measure protein